MRWRRLFSAIAIAFVLMIIIVTSFALGQGGFGEQLPPPKMTFVAKQTELVKTAEKLPTAPPGFVPEKFQFLLTPRSSCPNTQIKSMIGDYRADGPSYERGIVNVAVVIKNDVAYEILAGSPTDIQKQGIVILKQLGMIIVRQQFIDPCAAGLAGKTLVPEYYYTTPNGTLTITQIDGDTVVVSIAGGGTDRFNFVTGQFAQIKPLTVTPIPIPTRPPYP